MIRLARTADADSIKFIVLAAFKKYAARLAEPPDPVKQDFNLLVSSNNTHVLTAGGCIVGTVTCLVEGSDLIMRNLGVHPCHQRRGYGEQLVTFAENEGRRLGCTSMKFWTREEMVEVHRFYINLGYDKGYTVRTQTRSTTFFSKPLSPPIKMIPEGQYEYQRQEG